MLDWILLTAVVASSPTASASRPGDQSQQIIVEGQRGRDRAIHDFVKAVTPARIGGQLSRYDIEACPASVGLSEAQNLQVTERLREVAAAAGVPLAKEKCGPNALVIVVDRKDDFLAALDKRYPVYFSEMINGAMKPPKEPGPATAWHITGSMSSDHIATSVNHPGATGVPGTYYVSSSMDASRLIPPRIPHFLAGVLVVEARSLSGLHHDPACGLCSDAAVRDQRSHEADAERFKHPWNSRRSNGNSNPADAHDLGPELSQSPLSVG